MYVSCSSWPLQDPPDAVKVNVSGRGYAGIWNRWAAEGKTVAESAAAAKGMTGTYCHASALAPGFGRGRVVALPRDQALADLTGLGAPPMVPTWLWWVGGAVLAVGAFAAYGGVR